MPLLLLATALSCVGCASTTSSSSQADPTSSRSGSVTTTGSTATDRPAAPLSSRSSRSAAGEPVSVPLKIIPSGDDAGVRFQVSEVGGRVRVTAVAHDSVAGVHTDVHLVNAAGKATSTEIATTDLGPRSQHPVAEFSLEEVRKASILRVVYHAEDAAPAEPG